MRSFSFCRPLAGVLFFLALLLPSAHEAFGQKRRKNVRKPVAVRTEKPPASISPNKCSIESQLTADEREAILADQNKARAALGLVPLKWDCGLASFAQTWANAGRFRHRDAPDVGENLFVSSNASEPIASVVPDWLDEKPNYDTATGECKPDTVCTHYSQIMWRKTTLVGCGINRSIEGKWRVLVVCNYSPAGNTGGPAY
ncbi:MAG: Cysteine-rich secretory protein family protein [Acidobacteria bacterium OLB17]|nr:MAG: Cysteine-rich secretory protein family protein [Acidobacteria bacterium OLB17]MCZ2389716.1 CAP domain-containing protein [Acidobacteriota bacterium]